MTSIPSTTQVLRLKRVKIVDPEQRAINNKKKFLMACTQSAFNSELMKMIVAEIIKRFNVTKDNNLLIKDYLLKAFTEILQHPEREEGMVQMHDDLDSEEGLDLEDEFI